MQTEKDGQNYSMPLDNLDLHGIEKDGNKSNEYCSYCYRDGAFINPNMTLKERASFVITQMENEYGFKSN